MATKHRHCAAVALGNPVTKWSRSAEETVPELLPLLPTSCGAFAIFCSSNKSGSPWTNVVRNGVRIHHNKDDVTKVKTVKNVDSAGSAGSASAA